MFFTKRKYALPGIEKFANLLSWWRVARNHFNRFPFCSSTHTKNLDLALTKFDVWVDNAQVVLSTKRLKRLVVLHAAISSWVGHHTKFKLSSKRNEQVEQLQSWVR